MLVVAKPVILLLRSLVVLAVVTLGVISILATGGGSSGDAPPYSFADAGQDYSAGTGEWIRLDGTGSNTPLSDNPEDDELLYFWTVISSPPIPEGPFPFPETYILLNPDSLRPSIKPIIEGEYVVQLRVKYGRFNGWDTVSVFATDGPVPPMAKAGPDQIVKHGSLVKLDASASFSHLEHLDTYSDRPFRYNWYINKWPAAASPSLSASDVVNPRFIAEYDPDDLKGVKPPYSLYETQLNLINGKDMVSKPVHVNTLVFPPEGYVYPVPVAGPGQKVMAGSTVELDGSASFDVDDRPLTYNWKFYARPADSTATLTGADTATPSFVADVDGIYVVHLQVSNEELAIPRLLPSDTFGYAEWKHVDFDGHDRVVVTAVSNPSTAIPDAGPDQLLSYTGAMTIPLDGSGSIDLDGDPIAYRWYLLSAPSGSSATIDNHEDTQPDSASLLADIPGSYVIGLNTDIWHIEKEYENDHVIITLTENSTPTADAGEDQDVSVGDSVMLDGSVSSDPDANPLGYSWSLASAPGEWGSYSVNGLGFWRDWPKLSDGMSASPSFTPDLNGEYRLRLTVNDGEQNSVVDEVIITATGGAANTPPTAEAGPDQSVTVGDTVMLNGNASSDPETDPLTYLWSIENRPLGSSAALDDPASVTPSFMVDMAGSYLVQLIVNDGIVDSAADTMVVTASLAGQCPYPLTVVTALPFAPNMGEMATNIEINASGSDELSLRMSGMLLASDVYQARIPDSNNPDQAEFVIIGSDWEEISRSHNNPISDSDSPSFIVRNISENTYYKINVGFTGTNLMEVQVDDLSGCRCGDNAGSCP